MLIHTKISDGCHIMATSQGVMVYGKNKKLVDDIQSKIDQSNGKYWLYPNEIIFFDDTYKRFVPNEEHHTHQKTSFWQKLFGH